MNPFYVVGMLESFIDNHRIIVNCKENPKIWILHCVPDFKKNKILILIK